MTLIRSAILVIFTFTSIIFSAAAASATPAASSTSLNVRSGPGTSFGVVDTLFEGEIVEVTECQANGWCYVEHTGTNGWVSSSYLTIAPEPSGEVADPDCSLSLTIGPDGPSLTITCGDGGVVLPAPDPEPEPAPPVGNQACFYTNANFGGSEFCYGVGTLNSLNATFNDRISSVKLDGIAKVQLCADTNLGGYCRTIDSNVTALGLLLNDRASSLKVFTQMLMPIPIPIPLPVPVPVTFSTGPIALQQTFTANLDDGTTGGSGVDIWYRAVTATNKMISPRSGALLALGDGSNRGFAGCNTASYSANPIPLPNMPVGTYVCVKTDQGRISQFRVNGFTGTTMNIGYTTWAN